MQGGLELLLFALVALWCQQICIAPADLKPSRLRTSKNVIHLTSSRVAPVVHAPFAANCFESRSWKSRSEPGAIIVHRGAGDAPSMTGVQGNAERSIARGLLPRNSARNGDL